MELNILVLIPALDPDFPQVNEQCLSLIQQAAPALNMTDGSALLTAEIKGDEKASQKLDQMLLKSDIIFGFIPPKNLIKRSPRLKWLQVTSAGVDRLANSDVWKSPIIITGVSGIHAGAISEFVLGTMLAMVKNSTQGFSNKQTREWKRYGTSSLLAKTAGIIGLGNIGRETARLCKAFGMRVIATRRSTRQTGKARYTDLLLPQEDMNQLLCESDFVIVSVPLTPDTRHLIGEKELRVMKPSAYLINIARGAVIDEQALIAALTNNIIAGAGLDVTEQEPLPTESPLWNMNNVILTPHVSGGMEDYMLQATKLFCENLVRYQRGRPMLNVVKRNRGY